MKLKNSVLEIMLVRLGQSVHPGDCRKADLATMLTKLKTEQVIGSLLARS